jgi:hypothetical protein
VCRDGQQAAGKRAKKKCEGKEEVADASGREYIWHGFDPNRTTQASPSLQAAEAGFPRTPFRFAERECNETGALATRIGKRFSFLGAAQRCPF